VIAADLPIVAQRAPGATLRFVETTTAEAVGAFQRARLSLADRGTEGVLSA
jgi:allophanate hydrolase subunit 2